MLPGTTEAGPVGRQLALGNQQKGGGMSPQKQQLAIAEACKHDLWVIVKRGLYYRANAHGYTNSIAEAWKLPKEEAKKHEMYADRSDVDQCEKVLIQRAPLPDYLNDLNAIHEAIAQVIDPRFIQGFHEALYEVLERHWTPKRWYMFSTTGQFFAFTIASAAQLSEAFVKAISKWEDTTV